MKGREIISLPVITPDNKPIGEIKDIICDYKNGQVVGFILELGGWLSDGRGFLIEDIVQFNGESIVIKDESDVREFGSMPKVLELIKKQNELKGMQVQDTSGKVIGTVDDVVVDQFGAPIIGYEISDGVIQDLLSGRATIPQSNIIFDDDKILFQAESDKKEGDQE